MRRYQFLNEREAFEALNKLRNAFLAAKDGNEVEVIINGLLTPDEKLKIGRRILIAECLLAGIGIDEISQVLKVGKNTIIHVSRQIEKYTKCFDLISKRAEIVEKEYKNKAYNKVGGSQKVFKTRMYTGFKRKDVNRK